MARIWGCILIATGWLLSCGPGPTTQGSTERFTRGWAATQGSTERFTHGWAGWNRPDIGCVPKGKVQQLRGTLRPQPLDRRGRKPGKGFGGTRLVLKNGAALVVSYGATTQHRRLAGKTVIASGRYCDKQGQAIVGQHFNVERVAIVGK